MTEKQVTRRDPVYRLTVIAVMAAMVYVLTMFRFPLAGSKVHFANALCLLSGLLLGPVGGGIAAGLGSALYDALAGGYDLVNVLITFFSKFAMGWVCGMIVLKRADREKFLRCVLACLAGALTYVFLYLLKTYIFQRFVYAYPLDATWATVLSKAPASLINAAVAVVAAPLFHRAVMPALRSTGILEKL